MKGVYIVSQKISNIFRKNNRVNDLDDILADIYDLILSKVNEENICKNKIIQYN